ncbi:3-phosphoserine/phosphohydroxythreonine transaminase [Candidatus Marinamargulisbacteria bacterium SCGC AAA071-K20]|nr:3-phosphoserine/phosphohydroxythreonine transaminase [Candidatus Marinamargulisbacteria bacterium SCGC AAA071-K20]
MSNTAVTEKRIHNFSAGPAVLPLEVLETAQKELTCFKDEGASVMEISHRSAAFEAVIFGARDRLRRLMNIPENYEILFMQGGASLQFCMIPMNFLEDGKPVQAINTGAWTTKAIKEINKQGSCDSSLSSEADNFRYIPKFTTEDVNANASYVYITSNNTIAGTQWENFPDTNDVPLVCDMSSDILSRNIDVSKFGLIFAGAQKNIGPSGVGIVIVRKDLLQKSKDSLPTFLNYNTHVKNDSMFNTPPTFAIYMMGLVLEWLEDNGGISAIQEKNEKKAAKLYDFIDNSEFYQCKVKKDSRSNMNVVFRINDDESLEKAFVSESKAKGLNGLKGHRLVGGLRASIYNNLPEESVDALISFMKDFQEKNQ